MKTSTADCALLGGSTLIIASTFQKSLGLSGVQGNALAIAGGLFVVFSAFLRWRDTRSPDATAKPSRRIILTVLAVFALGVAVLVELFYRKT
jgi:hypothetical protein